MMVVEATQQRPAAGLDDARALDGIDGRGDPRDASVANQNVGVGLRRQAGVT